VIEIQRAHILRAGVTSRRTRAAAPPAQSVTVMMGVIRRKTIFGLMSNPYCVVLDEASLRWAAAEGVCEAVIAAICLLETKSVNEIVARLTPVELEQVIKIVGQGRYDALKVTDAHQSRSPLSELTPIRNSTGPMSETAAPPRARAAGRSHVDLPGSAPSSRRARPSALPPTP
jgi:hypothetical protein